MKKITKMVSMKSAESGVIIPRKNNAKTTHFTVYVRKIKCLHENDNNKENVLFS